MKKKKREKKKTEEKKPKNREKKRGSLENICFAKLLLNIDGFPGP